MLNPSPVPLPWDLVVKNGSKILSRISGAMPVPVSVTRISTPSSVGSVPTVTRPPGWQASMALVTRLSTTWLILRG